jgi:uncharacterized damage-inducible protein DinB
MMEPMLNELRHEAETTKRLLDRVPENEFGWSPHPRSMSLGQLALHVANIPGDLTRLAQLDQFDAANANFEPAKPESKEAVMNAFRTSLSAASEYLEALSPDIAGAPWRLTLRGIEVFSMPRAVMLRSLLLNHWYHHRGQLSVYLRLLDVPVPVIYGRSADENPLTLRRS